MSEKERVKLRSILRKRRIDGIVSNKSASVLSKHLHIKRSQVRQCICISLSPLARAQSMVQMACFPIRDHSHSPRCHSVLQVGLVTSSLEDPSSRLPKRKAQADNKCNPEC